MSDDFKQRLDEALDENRLEFRDGQVGPKQAPRDSGNMGHGIAMRMTIEFLATITLGAFAGHWLDEKLGTSPWMIILLVFLGFGVALVNIYRTLNDIPEGIGLNPHALREKSLTQDAESLTSDTQKD